jgi:hypothetical protein
MAIVSVRKALGWLLPAYSPSVGSRRAIPSR